MWMEHNNDWYEVEANYSIVLGTYLQLNRMKQWKLNKQKKH